MKEKYWRILNILVVTVALLSAYTSYRCSKASKELIVHEQQGRLRIVSKLEIGEVTMNIVQDKDTKIEFLIIMGNGKVKNIFKIDNYIEDKIVEDNSTINPMDYKRWSPTI